MRLSLNDVSLSIEDKKFNYNISLTDSIIGIFGFSGSGKTTFLNCIAGLLKPDSGSIRFNDTLFFDDNKNINLPPNRRDIGFVFQEHFLFPHLTVKQNLVYSRLYTKDKSIHFNFDAVLSLLDLEDFLYQKPFQLSGGERQRVAIGRALLSQPRLLLFDEPFSNLDKTRRKEIISYLLKINAYYQIPMFIISHDLEDILKLTSYLVIIDKGTIVTAGNCIDIAESGKVAGIAGYSAFTNIFDVYCINQVNDDNTLLRFSDAAHSKKTFICAAASDHTIISAGQKTRLSVLPEDVIIAREPFIQSSIQNQIKGVVLTITIVEQACYINVDCGINIIAEITIAAQQSLDFKKNDYVYCLIKARAVKIVHGY
ncbi:MAG: molybdenum ABC transporter ATP-binding protein [Spirochaetes bacterium]|jgi:molybdate transport system ATP-binding protein|nr:molybdenum ABC transporter ATP-binding protein [Spirochaetota bacterium]